MEENRMVCEICGKNLKTKIVGHNSILYCEEHGDMLVTTYFDEYEKDYTKYDIILLPGNNAETSNIKLISKISNKNFIESKRLLMSKKDEVIYRNYSSNCDIKNAYAIKEVAQQLQEANIRYKINPEFKHNI